MKRAKVVHENLNAGGGSERLAFATIELLNEMNFVVDLATLQKPNLKEIEKDFGNDTSHLWKFNQIEILDMYSLLDIEDYKRNEKQSKNPEDIDKANSKGNISLNDEHYDLIINTHGDIFSYFKVNREYKNNYTKEKNEDINQNNVKFLPSTIKITYCHHPIIPQLIKRRDYLFLEKLFDSFNEFPQKIKDAIALKVFENYNQMMNRTFIITNSKFSKEAIEEIFGDDKVKTTIVYPPVDIDKFKIVCNRGNNKNIYKFTEKDPNSIIVISRINYKKSIENAIEIGKKLKEKENINYFNMTIVGNTNSDNQGYLEKLNSLIAKYNLKDNIKIKPDVPFDELQKLIQRTSIYIHPTLNEPFGISIVEAMSAGLIPIAPDRGGNTEFVPSNYQYQSIAHATEIIAKIIKNKNVSNELENERKNISDLTNNFSKKKYKENLRKIIELLFLEREQKVLEIQKTHI
ncbi:MAG TPA: glycosyltransferase [Nitrososphaeraceae archaeon]|nr:glycosyltransferase [Nitrososphaeraceae archaeon]